MCVLGNLLIDSFDRCQVMLRQGRMETKKKKREKEKTKYLFLTAYKSIEGRPEKKMGPDVHQGKETYTDKKKKERHIVKKKKGAGKRFLEKNEFPKNIYITGQDVNQRYGERGGKNV
jgi:hypothetical protein